MQKSFLVTGSILGVTAVILGAFGAHALKAILDAEAIQSYQTGVRYQMFHALLLLIVGAIGNKLPKRTQKTVYYLITIGVLFFSVSIYLLTILDLTSIALLTPLGGSLMIIGWIFLLFGVLKIKSNPVKGK